MIAGGFEDVLLSNGKAPSSSTAAGVGNTFRFLGVPALAGRILNPDDAARAPPVFVMSYKMWIKHYNLDPVDPRTDFILNGVPTTLVGIMPTRFTKLAADLYRP